MAHKKRPCVGMACLPLNRQKSFAASMNIVEAQNLVKEILQAKTRQLALQLLQIAG